MSPTPKSSPVRFRISQNMPQFVFCIPTAGTQWLGQLTKRGQGLPWGEQGASASPGWRVGGKSELGRADKEWSVVHVSRLLAVSQASDVLMKTLNYTKTLKQSV